MPRLLACHNINARDRSAQKKISHRSRHRNFYTLYIQHYAVQIWPTARTTIIFTSCQLFSCTCVVYGLWTLRLHLYHISHICHACMT